MRTKNSFLAFNLLWCIGSFLLPFVFIPVIFKEANLFIVTAVSLGIYIRSVLSQSYKDWIEYRLFELENKESTPSLKG